MVLMVKKIQGLSSLDIKITKKFSRCKNSSIRIQEKTKFSRCKNSLIRIQEKMRGSINQTNNMKLNGSIMAE